MPYRTLSISAALILAVAAPSQSRVDSTTRPAAAYDDSSARAAADGFNRAADAGDADGLRAMMSADTRDQRQFADALTEFVIAARRVAIESGKRWPAHSATLPADPAIAQPEQFSAPSFHNVAGHWLLDPAEYLSDSGRSGISDDTTIAAQTRLLHELAIALNDAASDIAADRYRTADDAESNVRQKLRAVVGHTYRHSPPTTAPAATQSSAR